MWCKYKKLGGWKHMKYEYKTITIQAEGIFGGKMNNNEFEHK